MKTRFAFTIDVESRSKGNPEVDILGILPGFDERCGIERMMDVLEAHDARGTFFLNVYEADRHNASAIPDIARLIHSRGHDLQLHTHPHPMFEFRRINRASLSDQVEILEKGISLIQDWTGKRVVAHRAGAFAANGDTLRASEAVQLSADCSLSPGTPAGIHARLVDELGATNVVQRVGRMWVIPVTYYDQIRVGSWHSRRILDIEGSSLAEIKDVTNQAVRQGLPTVCILGHSFSFSRHGRPDSRAIRRFSALVEWLSGQDAVEISTVERICAQLDAEVVPTGAYEAPCTGIWLTWSRALRSWRDGWKNFLVASAGICCMVGIVVVLVWLGCVLLGT
jgi:hypothetical protein